MSAEGVEAIHLRAGGVSVLLDVRGHLLPQIVHWGADLGPLSAPEAAALTTAKVAPWVNNTMDEPLRVAVLPEQRTGWLGRPGISGSRDGRAWSPRFAVHGWRCSGPEHRESGLVTLSGGGVEFLASDPLSELELTLCLELSLPGVLRASAGLTNRGARYRVEDVSLAFPVPAQAGEILDFAGRWAKERTPQRGSLAVGAHVREGRRGRTGADAATVLSLGERGFGFARGQVWGVHVGFSGNHRHYAERLSSGEQVIGGGELLLPGEIVLDSGQTYRTPWIYGLYGDGLDAQAGRLHQHLRARPHHPRTPRPVTLNVWEAVYFDHDLDSLLALAELAAEVGVERFVLDDGWFRGRRDDRSGLGDWYVDEDVWPRGLTPLIERVRQLGMGFGLWFEPEMVNLDSAVARAHPEWILRPAGRLPAASRHQQVMNLGVPAAYAYVRDRMVDLLTHIDISYLKWDHNRDLVDAGRGPEGEPGVHDQTLAAYRLMGELRQRFPGLEIESCSSGGARIDLGVIEHADRVWVSDCIDPLERQAMNRWTTQLLLPELLGSHIASARSHTTGRTHDLAFRAATALFAHLGVEWNLADASEAELSELAAWIACYRERRALLHSGTVIRMDPIDDALLIGGVVAADRSAALFSLAYLYRPAVAPSGVFTLRGLDPDRHYRVRPLTIGRRVDERVPPWFGLPEPRRASDRVTLTSPLLTAQDEPEGIVLSGRLLTCSGLQAPLPQVESVWLLEVTAVDSPGAAPSPDR